MSTSCYYCERLLVKYPGVELRPCQHDLKELDANTVLHQPKHKAVGARIFIHPRCYQGPAAGALLACLQEHGYDANKVSVGPANRKGHCELVRLHGSDPDGLMHLERMDGEKFDYKSSMPPTVGTVA